MLSAQRVLVATLCGFVFGLVCMFLASSNPNPVEPITSSTKWLIIISRTMMGFTLGISALRMSWWLHGIVIGFIASIPMAIPVISTMNIAIGTLVLGIVYGFLTEVITSKLFKLPSVGAIKKA